MSGYTITLTDSEYDVLKVEKASPISQELIDVLVAGGTLNITISSAGLVVTATPRPTSAKRPEEMGEVVDCDGKTRGRA